MLIWPIIKCYRHIKVYFFIMNYSSKEYCFFIIYVRYILHYYIIIYITLDNTIYTLTPPRIGSFAVPHHLHLYLVPHDRLPYLQHTCTGIDPKSYCLIITTSLPSQGAGSSSSWRRPMLRTTSHVPDLVITITFPSESTQH